MSNIPSSNIEQLLEVAIDAVMVDTHTCLPGKFVSFDPATQLASVQLQIKRIVEDKDGNQSPTTIPVLLDVPVLFHQVQNFVITLPIKPGDECLVYFSERDIDNWHEKGDTSAPRTRRRFDFSDGFAMPMLSSKPNKISNYNADDMEIRKKDASSKIVIKSNGDIEIVNSTQIDITTPTLNINGDVNVTGKIDATGDIKSGAISLNSHLHGGVQIGGSNTTGPI